jgi:hypothetical protein
MIRLVDLKRQHESIKGEIDAASADVLRSQSLVRLFTY